ncbi:MAG: hypothetical protein Q8J78_01365 [Moraxellaceae bacterium]|nr:hypothetical protein [Moraxellaceae bacterium]
MLKDKLIDTIEPQIYGLAVRYLAGETLRALQPESGLSFALMHKKMLLLCRLIGHREGLTFDSFHAMKPWKLKLMRLIEREHQVRFAPTDADAAPQLSPAG